MKLAVQPRKPEKPERGKFPDRVRNWPHPGRPGWPHHYDRDGYFCVEDLVTRKRFALMWDSTQDEWDCGWAKASPSVIGKFHYLGPCSVIYRDGYDPNEQFNFGRRPRRF